MSKTPVLDEALALVARTDGICFYHYPRGMYSWLDEKKERHNGLEIHSSSVVGGDSGR